MNKTFRIALLAAALISLVACNSDEETANDLPKGQWFSAGSETDPDGMVNTSYVCFANNGVSHSVNLEAETLHYEANWSRGPYSVSGSKLSVSYTEKIEYSGSVMTSDLSKGEMEPMGDDEVFFTAEYAVAGDTLTVTFKSFETKMLPVAKVPAYMAGISCK